MRKIDRTGEEKFNKFGSKMKIIKYNNSDNIIVEFENGYKTKRSYNDFKKGKIISPYDKTLYCIGYLGEGKYKTSINGKHTLEYNYWRGIIERSYSDKVKNKCPTYKDVTCCDEWLCFQNFAKWHSNNYYTIENQTMDIDKDILVKGNKVYSPETCVFVPHVINGLFVKSNKSRGNLPIGVSVDKRDGIYSSRLKIINKDKYLGRFKTIDEAFYSYKIEKEMLIKQVADEYKDKIPKKLYDAMYKYKVEITD